MERMTKEKKVHLEWAMAYWPQDYEVVDEMKILKEENKKLREEVEQLKNQRIFNSTEYDLITLTSTTPQWELRRK